MEYLRGKKSYLGIYKCFKMLKYLKMFRKTLKILPKILKMFRKTLKIVRKILKLFRKMLKIFCKLVETFPRSYRV